MLSVALTGNLASGKSTVSEIWRAEGVPVVSADQLARRALAPGSPGLADVVEAFGVVVLAPDGSLDRDRVREIAFNDDRARARLEAIVHPLIRELRARWLEERTVEGRDLVACEIPLLFETGSQEEFDVVVFVDAPETLRLERAVRDRGLSEGEARRIMAAQMDAAAKRGRSDAVLVNDGDLVTLKARALATLAELRTRAKAATRDAAAVMAAEPGGADLMRLDLHLHTWGSWDCLSDPERVLERASARGVERIAVTDHNSLTGALRLAERHPDRVIPGEEVKTAEGVDVIGLYLEREIAEGTPAAETCSRIRDQGGLVYLPHPFARGKGGSGALADVLAPLTDVVEVFNGRLHPARLNGLAEDLAARHGCLRGAGSDAHTLGEVAGARVEVPRHANRPDALREALARGRIHGRTASNAVHLASTWAKVRRRVFGVPGDRGGRANPSER